VAALLKILLQVTVIINGRFNAIYLLLPTGGCSLNSIKRTEVIINKFRYGNGTKKMYY
jgi:hypothetical protein